MVRVISTLSTAVTGLLVLGLLVGAPAQAQGAAPAQAQVQGRAPALSAHEGATAPQAAAPAAYSRQAVRATNRHRAKRGHRTLRGNRCLQRFANSHATRMARERRMYHQDLQPILRRCGLSMVGENVAYGYPTGRAVVNQGWMRSPGHRANILRREYRTVAVGARRGSDGRWYAAQVFGR